MAKISNSLLCAVNFVSLLGSLPIIGIGVWFRIHAASECERFLHLPILVSGAVLFVVSVLGFVGPCCRATIFLWLYLFFLFLAILALVAFTVFVIVTMNKRHGVENYSGLQKRVVLNLEAWRKIESCLRAAKVCSLSETEVGFEAPAFYKQSLMHTEFGCCKPPANCRGAGCEMWSTDQDKLCYGCSSCKAGVLASFKEVWKVVAYFNFGLLVLLIAMYMLGVCAMRNNRATRHLRNNQTVPYYTDGYF